MNMNKPSYSAAGELSGTGGAEFAGVPLPHRGWRCRRLNSGACRHGPCPVVQSVRHFQLRPGAIGAVAAGLFYQLYVLNHLPVGIAIAATLLVWGIGFGCVMERIAYLLRVASSAMKVVATVGVMVSLTALFTLRFGSVPSTFPTFLPQSTFTLGGVNVSYAQVAVTVLGLIAAIGMGMFFKRTMTGRSMRAIVDDPVLVSLIGTNPTTIRRWAWIIGSTFAAIAGVLIAPSLGLDGTSLTLLVISSFGAAAIGGFSSLPWTYVGAILIEVMVSVATKWASTSQSLQSLPATLPFLALFVVLLVYPKQRLVEIGASLHQRVPRLPQPSKMVRTIKLIPVVAFLILAPDLVGPHLLVWMVCLTYVIIEMSLSLLVRTSNQISLCQMSFAAVGAVASYRLIQVGVPWPLAIVGGGLITIPIGAIVAVPAIRLSGIYLALATLAFGIVLETTVFQTFLMFGGSGVSLATLRPSFATSDTKYYYLLVVAVALCYAFVRALERSRLGQLLRSKADSPEALEGLGVNNTALSSIAFCAAAFVAGIAGGLIGPIFGVVGSGSFETIPTSIMLVALLVIASHDKRIGTLGASIGAAIGLIVIPNYITSNTVLSCLDLLFGVAAVEAAVASTRTKHLDIAGLLHRNGRLNGKTPTGSNSDSEVEQLPSSGEVVGSRAISKTAEAMP